MLLLASETSESRVLGLTSLHDAHECGVITECKLLSLDWNSKGFSLFNTVHGRARG